MTLLQLLPAAPSNKKGWPWTEESLPPPALMPDGENWPRISIITPSFNQGCFIEETIRSIILQNYPNIEYIIIDGGSSDETVSIIKKYAPWISYWVSEPDKGQTHAINKGFSMATGQIMAWINSDDLLMPNALAQCALQIALEYPDWLIGACNIVNRNGHYKRTQNIFQISEKTFFEYQTNYIPQPSTFWNRLMWDAVGELKIGLHYVMDVDLWFRMLQIAEPKIYPQPLSQYREHSETKSIQASERSAREFAEWFCDEIIGVNHSSRGRLRFDLVELIIQHIAMQIKFQRIKHHSVIGRLLKFWTTHINPDLPK